MADPTPASADTEVPAVDISPAVPPAPVVMPGPDEMLAKIKAKLYTAVAPAEPEKKDEPATEGDDKPKLNLDPKVMKTLGRLQEEVRTATAKVKELEPLKADAEFGKSIRDLWGKTPEQKLEALAKLSGRDGTDELAALVQFFYERDQEGAAPNADGTPKATPETKALLDAIGELKKEVAELKTGNTSKEEERTKAAAEEDRKNAAAYVERFLTSNKAKFEISARKENIGEATDLIQAAAMTIVARDRIDIKTLTEQSANDLYLKAAAEVEKEYEDTGRRFAKVSARPVFDPDKYGRPLSRPTVTIKREPLSKDPKVAETQLRDRLQRKLENGEFHR